MKLLFVLSLLISSASFAAVDAQALLAASDAIRNPTQAFGLTSTLIEYRKGKESGRNTLAIYSRPDGGRFRNLIRFVAPIRDAGKLLLKDGNDLWFYDPASKASVRISPQQRLLGQAANGDVLTVNLALDYRAELAGEEEIQDGDRKQRAAYKLKLKAISPDITYHSIEMWLDKSTKQPLKSLFYTESGRLLKTAYFRRYQTTLGAERPSETVIIDGLDPAWVTVIKNSDYAWRDVPESWLQRDYLPRFKPE
jgi:outer membrane lipoprotein-sorting protein